MIVDGHLHLFRRFSRAYPRAVTELYPAAREALAEDLLKVMAANDVGRAVLVAPLADDAYLLDCLHRYPRSFVGVAVQAADDPAPEQHLERLTELGIRGLRVAWLGKPASRRPEDLPLFATLKKMAEGGQVLWFYAPSDQLPLLAMVVAALPELRVVLNHLGFCPADVTVDSDGRPHIRTVLPAPTLPSVLALARHPNVYVMLSGQYAFSHQPYPYDDLTPTVGALFEAYGPERMFWASDYPMIAVNPGYDRVIELPSRHLPGLSSADLDLIMRGTASRLFNVDEPSGAPPARRR